jgi:hypothetical protein
MVDIFEVDVGVELKVFFGFGGDSFEEVEESCLLVKLRKVLNIPDRQQEKLHHFLELVVLEVVIMVLDVVD